MTVIKKTLVSICPKDEGLTGIVEVNTIDQIHPITTNRVFETTVFGVHTYSFDRTPRPKIKFHEQVALVETSIEETNTDLIRHDVIVNKLLAGEYEYDIELGDPETHEPSIIHIYELTEEVAER